MPAIDLQAVLAAKEKRAFLREELRQTYGLPILTFSVNRPGPEKDGPEIRRLLRHAVELFLVAAETQGIDTPDERFIYLPAGPFALVTADSDPVTLKRMAMEIEDGSEYGRLFDIDVYDATGAALSRHMSDHPARSCFLCSESAVLCMRSRRHDMVDLQKHFQLCFSSFASRSTDPWPSAVWDITGWAVESMLVEVACTPAPGLVDRVNSGAHEDMDFFTFMKSTGSLIATMSRCAAAGWLHSGPSADLLPTLRHIGQDGERRMFSATKGVNTQKGLVFLLGILCAAAAVSQKRRVSVSAQEICREVSLLCEGIVARELHPLLTATPERTWTAGERLFLRYQATGIRGEMERGLPSVLQLGLPCLRDALATGLCLNDALVQTLMVLLSVVEDTTVLHRHNWEVLQEVQAKADSILRLGGMSTAEGVAAIHNLDAEFISRRISPGGTADLLAATYFLWLAEKTGQV